MQSGFVSLGQRLRHANMASRKRLTFVGQRAGYGEAVPMYANHLGGGMLPEKSQIDHRGTG